MKCEADKRPTMTITTDVQQGALTLARMVREADRIAGFTGAGISTECGVPDFRSPGSPWMLNKPIPFRAFTSSAEARQEAWKRKFVMDDTYAGAQPGRGHRALAALHASGKMPDLITQNIDGLHQQSGIPPEAVIELHGNGTFAKCLDCGAPHDLGPVREAFMRDGEAPPCSACGGLLKSATISFGQPMPEMEMQKAARATLAADLFIAIGSSLVVFPAASLPRAARENGARLVIVNAEPTALDPLADLVVRADIGDVLCRMQASLTL